MEGSEQSPARFESIIDVDVVSVIWVVVVVAAAVVVSTRQTQIQHAHFASKTGGPRAAQLASNVTITRLLQATVCKNPRRPTVSDPQVC